MIPAAFWWYVGGFVLMYILAQFIPSPEPPDTIEIRPTLSGEDLEQWTAIYQAISISYQHSLVSESGVADMTWDRWGKLTGKETWETIPNPSKIVNEAK